MQSKACQLLVVDEVDKGAVCARNDGFVQNAVYRDRMIGRVELRTVYVCSIGDIQQICLPATVRVSSTVDLDHDSMHLLVGRRVVLAAMSVAVSRENKKHVVAHEMDIIGATSDARIALGERNDPFPNKGRRTSDERG